MSSNFPALAFSYLGIESGGKRLMFALSDKATVIACDAPASERLVTVTSFVDGFSELTMPFAPRAQAMRSAWFFLAISDWLTTMICWAGTDFLSAATKPRATTPSPTVISVSDVCSAFVRSVSPGGMRW